MACAVVCAVPTFFPLGTLFVAVVSCQSSALVCHHFAILRFQVRFHSCHNTWQKCAAFN